ncbi:MAG: 50S ribosomal protein L6 [Candidatus Acetothermia bacterium]
MSKIGKMPVAVPEDVEITIEGEVIRAKNEQGQEAHESFDSYYVNVEKQNGHVKVTRNGDSKLFRQRHGLYRSLIANMISGLHEPFEKVLQIEGLGYRARVQGNTLILELGYSHPIEYELPEGISAEVEDKTRITISGRNKQKVGQVAANVRNFRPPEPYKGKGIRYKGEQIIRKEGKLSGGEEAGLGA